METLAELSYLLLKVRSSGVVSTQISLFHWVVREGIIPTNGPTIDTSIIARAIASRVCLH